ncbi:ribonuclease H2 subunit B isoform X2 [Pseudophryne corroboree]|uniref:ribonuclease H2 subunit B isoform X2 n=1 Tax=Pseudophryne corroboree TaxID=495146 RepID=UPI003081D719
MLSRRKRLGDVQSDQWVLIAPETLKDDAKKPSEKTLFAKLRSPFTDEGAMFLFVNDGQQLCEVKAFNEELRSWFVGQTVQQDGRLLYATPVDPLFYVIYYLMKADKEQGKFQPVEQIVVDEEFPSCNLLLQCTKVVQSLHHVTEEKEDYVRYAHGLISEYIPEELRSELSQYINLPEISSPTPEPPTKTNSKMTAAQKSLAKVDRSGMKNISSFFSPKGKAAK